MFSYSIVNIYPKLETLVVFCFENANCRTKDVAKTHWRATVFRRYTFPAPSYLVSMTDSTCKCVAGRSQKKMLRKDRPSSSWHQRRMVGRGFFKCVDYCPKLSSREVHHHSVKGQTAKITLDLTSVLCWIGETGC